MIKFFDGVSWIAVRLFGYRLDIFKTPDKLFYWLPMVYDGVNLYAFAIFGIAVSFHMDVFE